MKPTAERVTLNPADERYREVLDRRFNKRFAAHPAQIQVVHTTDQAIAALTEAVDSGRRAVVTSGGHCLEGFVSDPEVRVLIDVSPMRRVYYDAERQAIAVEAGATVGETFRALFDSWRTVLPLGEHPKLGMGGHVVGGAFGFLCRQHGLAADHLYAVEVLTVDRTGTVRCVTASREPSDPNRELWWAHTGGGGGNFGLVTKYWFRSANTSGSSPATLLPRAPESVATLRAEWNWDDIDRSAFIRLFTSCGMWAEQNCAPDSPAASLFTLLIAHRREVGKIVVRAVSTAGASADRQLTEYLDTISDGLPAAPPEIAHQPWLAFALNPFPDLFAEPPGGVRTKVKDAMLKKRFTEHQLGVAYEYLTRSDFDVMGGIFGLASYGGRVNSVAAGATAAAQRRSILDAACSAGWLDAAEDERHLAWTRRFYRELFSDTGGVPVPGEAYDGTLINHPDVDLADPAWNTSGVPWSTLYYHDHYARLQTIKARWDPRNVFRHALSIRPA
jgi:aclacinomycin oxidase